MYQLKIYFYDTCQLLSVLELHPDGVVLWKSHGVDDANCPLQNIQRLDDIGES